MWGERRLNRNGVLSTASRAAETLSWEENPSTDSRLWPELKRETTLNCGPSLFLCVKWSFLSGTDPRPLSLRRTETQTSQIHCSWIGGKVIKLFRSCWRLYLYLRFYSIWSNLDTRFWNSYKISYFEVEFYDTTLIHWSEILFFFWWWVS